MTSNDAGLVSGRVCTVGSVVAQLDVTTVLTARGGEVVRFAVEGGVEAFTGPEPTDGADGRHRRDDDTDRGFDDGPIHGDTHGPGGVWVDEEGGEETETDAGCDDGADVQG